MELISITKIKPAKYNPRRIDNAAFAGLCESLKKFGMPQPLVVNKRSGVLVSGHQRLKAAESLGWTEVPVVHVDLSDAEEKALNVTLNNRHIGGDYTEGLNELLEEIRTEMGDDFMESLRLDQIEIPEVEVIPTENDKEDETPAVPSVAKSKLGDLWTLGKHRLLCGDSTDILAVERLMDGAKADMVFTDPPYGMFLDTDFSSMDGLSPTGKSFLGTKGGKVHAKVAGDHDDFTPDLINAVFAAHPNCKEIFLWGADYYADILPDRNNGAWIVWDKRTNEGASEDQAESADRLFGSNFELCWSKAKHKREIARIRNGIFGVKNESGNSKTVHPTQKPVQLAEWFFDKWGKAGDNVADHFGGSGSTLIACEKTQRQCFMMELDPKYVDVILRRWAEYTGEDPVRDDGVTWFDLVNGDA
jgi:DNA modification methylase